MALKETAKTQEKKRSRNSLYLLYNLVSKDFKLKYRRSILGVIWSILNPLLMMLVMTLIFSNLFRFEFDDYPFALYLILGQVFFTLFQEGTNSSLRSIIDSAPLIKKIHIEKIIFPTEKVLFAVVNFLFSLLAVYGVLIFFAFIDPTPYAFSAYKMIGVPVLLVLLIFFTLGVSYLVSALTVFFRDIEHLWGVLTTLWFYLTPIFWPYEVLRDRGFEWVYTIIQFNPMYHFVTCFRQMMTGINLESDLGTIPEVGLCAIFAGVTFGVGLLVFRGLQKRFIFYI